MANAIILLGVTPLPLFGDTHSSSAPEKMISKAIVRTTQAYEIARQRYLDETNNVEAAWHFSRACYESAELATNNTLRSQRAQEGINAARKAVALNPRLAPAYYFLGLNQGQLARTRTTGALRLINDLERSWISAIALDPTFDNAGPHRALGILYRDAPGWPISIGDRHSAKQHLEKAVQLAPDYPGNFITALEMSLQWGQKETVRTNVPGFQKTLDAARTQLTGETWELSWHDWDRRWKEIVARVAVSPR